MHQKMSIFSFYFCLNDLISELSVLEKITADMEKLSLEIKSFYPRENQCLYLCTGDMFS